MLGRVVRDFKIEEKLAEGGMGAVYLARHLLLPDMRKVIKFLLPVYAANPVVCQRFHREAEAASKLRHECILGIDNFGALEDGQLFIMSPFLEGQPLDAYLRARGGRLAPHRALHLIVQLCDALDHAHSHGIIHRDLKPGNVFLVAANANPYTLKLLDFGIAKVIGEHGDGMTDSGTALGTPAYMAVEQYEHADEATHLADVYSLAIMTWEMVTGQLPWRHTERAVLYHLQRTAIPERPSESEMPARWTDVLLAALSVEPVMRPQSARELAMALASALPAVGRVPSGAEILAGLAPRFLRNAAPGDETVRNAAGTDRIGPLIWPLRETAPDRSLEPAGEKGSDAGSDAGASPPRSELLGAEPSAPRTTLSAATGVIEPPTRRAPRWMFLAGAAGMAVLAAILAAGMAAGFSSDGAAPGAASAPSAPPEQRALSGPPEQRALSGPPPDAGGPGDAPAEPGPPAPAPRTAAPASVRATAEAAPASGAPDAVPGTGQPPRPAPPPSGARGAAAGPGSLKPPGGKAAPTAPVPAPRGAAPRPQAAGAASPRPDPLSPINANDVY